jgi:putative transposase
MLISMARPLRVEYPGANYHITCRGIDRRTIFADDKDNEHFIYLLKEGADFFNVEIVSYCLMRNHYHLLLRTPKANLSRFMQRLNTAYTRYFNHKYNRVGPLMQGRYKAILVGSDEYFLTLSRYIYLNPVKLKKFNKLSKFEKRLMLARYKWSSYMSVLQPASRSRYFRSEVVLNFVGGDNSRGRKKYEEYVLQGLEGKIENPMDELKYQFLIGSEGFVKDIIKKYVEKKDLGPFDSVLKETRKKSIVEIAEIVAKEYEVKPEEIIIAHSKHIEARKILVELCYRLCLESKTLKEIGVELGGVTGAGVARVHERLSERIREDKNLSARFAKLMKLVCQ